MSDYLPSLSQIEGAHILDHHLHALVQLARENLNNTPEARQNLEQLSRSYLRLHHKVRELNRRLDQI